MLDPAILIRLSQTVLFASCFSQQFRPLHCLLFFERQTPSELLPVSFFLGLLC
jgi:hypothetical protein